MMVVAGVIVPLFHRARIGTVLGFLIAGVVLGPHGLGRFADEHVWVDYFTFNDPKRGEVLAEFGIPGVRVEGRSGVWLVDANRPAGDKIAAIGIRVADGVTMHGFALNCSNAFDAYRAIIACGILDAGVTSISRELGREITPEDVVPLIERHFAEHLAPSLASAVPA